MVAGGVPDRLPTHAERVAGLALELLTIANTLKDPLTGKSLQFKMGNLTFNIYVSYLELTFWYVNVVGITLYMYMLNTKYSTIFLSPSLEIFLFRPA